MRDRLLSAYGQILEQAEAAQLALRLTGSIAVQFRCPRHASLVGSDRSFADLDLVARKRDAAAVRAMLERIGYVENREIYVASEGGRAIYDHSGTQIHLDVFFDRLEFCHVIDIRQRIVKDRVTLPLAELLMGKLQIVEINAKDLRDASILLLEHPLADIDENAINVSEIARLCGAEWGLWRTTSENLDKLVHYADISEFLTPEQMKRLQQQIESLKNAIDAYPKSLSWRMRAKLGDRVKWYRDVEEVDE